MGRRKDDEGTDNREVKSQRVGQPKEDKGHQTRAGSIDVSVQL